MYKQILSSHQTNKEHTVDMQWRMYPTVSMTAALLTAKA